MKWSEISIHTTAEAIEAVSNLLYEMGANGVVIEDPEVLHRDWDTPFGEIYQLSPDDFPDEGVFVKAYLPADSESAGRCVGELKEQLAELTDYGLTSAKARLPSMMCTKTSGPTPGKSIINRSTSPSG